MRPRELPKTIYLGDRFCQRIAIDYRERRVEVEVNVISRVRSASGDWDYYTAEDIADGLLVFTGLKSVRFEPPGLVPNDSINGIEVEDFQGGFLFHVWIDSVGDAANHTEVELHILAEGLQIEDSKRRGECVE